MLKSACCWLRLVTVNLKLIAFIGVPRRQHFQSRETRIFAEHLSSFIIYQFHLDDVGYCNKSFVSLRKTPVHQASAGENAVIFGHGDLLHMSWKWCHVTLRVTVQHGDDCKVFYLRISRKKRSNKNHSRSQITQNPPLTETKWCYANGRFFQQLFNYSRIPYS